VRHASFLISIIIVASVAVPARPAGATGLFDDLPSFFSRPDTARALFVRQTECDFGERHASLLTGGLTVRPAARIEVRFDVQFPTVQSASEIEYGLGDILLRTAARLGGDSLNTSGLFLRADLRIPSGSTGLRPFSDASFEGGVGLEARVVGPGFALQGAALYTLADKKPHGEDFTNDAHATAAASISVMVWSAVSVRSSAYLVRYDGGDTRNMFLLSLECALSAGLALEIAGAFEAGNEAARVFDSCASVSLTYRFLRLLPPVSLE